MPELIVKVEGLDVVINRPKICIGLSVGGYINAEFLRMIISRFEEWSKKYEISASIDSTMPIDLSRNNVVEEAKKNNCEYIFFIDSDVLIEDGYLDRLLYHNKDIVSGVYYKKIPPYEPLPRKKVADFLYVPIECEGNSVIEIDGTGMGCLLVKMNVFDKIPYPWFEFKYHNAHGRWDQLSEDLYFCQKLRSTGIKIYCDPVVQCSHIGGIVGPNLSRLYKDFRILGERDREKTITELSEFLGISSDDIYNKWLTATESVAKEYREFVNQDHHDPKDFYKISKDYIFDLTYWHLSGRYMFDIDLIKSVKNKYPSTKKVLDFGSGCGDNAIKFAESGYDVSITDYDGYTSQFARFRAKKRGLNIKFYDIEKLIEDKFDIILVFDVLEHVPDNEFEKTIELLRSLKADSGTILTTISFDTQGGLYPMHYDESPEKIKMIERLNK